MFKVFVRATLGIFLSPKRSHLNIVTYNISQIKVVHGVYFVPNLSFKMSKVHKYMTPPHIIWNCLGVSGSHYSVKGRSVFRTGFPFFHFSGPNCRLHRFTKPRGRSRNRPHFSQPPLISTMLSVEGRCPPRLSACLTPS